MRILYCTDTWVPQVNGVTVVTALSVAGMARRGWTCGVVAPRSDDGAGREGGQDGVAARWEIPARTLPLYPEGRLAAPALGTVRRAIRDFRPDLVHCQTEFIVGRLGMWAARLAGIPVVTSYHTDFSRYAASYGIGWARPAIRTVLTRFHRQADRTVTPSAAARADLATLGVPDAVVWGGGVDRSLFAPTRRDPALRRRLGLDEAFTFVYVGRLAPEKSVDVVLEGFRRAAAWLPAGRVRLVVAGTGPDEARLRASAPDGTTFLGTLDRTRDLPALYASADAFAFASCTETLGLVVLEAMASGLPVIAAPVGGVATHLADGANGLAVPPGDPVAMAAAMVHLVEDPALCRQLARGALATAGGLDWSRELDRLDALYRDVLAAAARGRGGLGAARGGLGIPRWREAH